MPHAAALSWIQVSIHCVNAADNHPARDELRRSYGPELKDLVQLMAVWPRKRSDTMQWVHDSRPSRIFPFLSTLGLDSIQILSQPQVDTSLKVPLSMGHLLETEGILNTIQLAPTSEADVNLRDEDGWTARLKLQLVEPNVDIDYPNRWGEKALNCAVFIGHVGSVKLLLDEGANINLADEDHF
ncbi:hypothetical protein JG688_00017628 [Phytophthora aleatoria]|uniref:Uncharacterized protein n=1 Tax=Phytophthora aleatoria TaxID=2496075 RepID=A0A8J5IDK9_9STRA|nr:hypothetical protein JG688_00017628 [Phytophthora aleatoria]